MNGRKAVFLNTEALEFGWERTLDNLKPLLVLGVTSAFLAALERGSRDARGTLLVTLAIQLAQALVTMISLRSLLEIQAGRKVTVSQLPGYTTGFAAFVLTTMLLGLIVTGGLALLIVPGLVWAARFGFAPLLVVDEGREPLDALRESSRITQGVRGKLVLFGLAMFGVNLIGLAALGLGLLLSVPSTGLATIFVLRKLQLRAAALPRSDESPHGGELHPPLTI